jgi:DNA-directed RNA polymerase specialized sigma24 family protein
LSDPLVGPLLARMQRGDREAAAEFIQRFGSRIQRRIRGKLSQPMRRVFDSLDILATLSRRLDGFVLSGRLEARNEPELWALVFRIAERALVDKARLFRRLEAAESEDGEFAQRMLARLRTAETRGPHQPEIELERAFRCLPDGTDRAILSAWLSGTPHVATAEWVGLTPAAVRQRWQAIRARLREVFEAELA